MKFASTIRVLRFIGWILATAFLSGCGGDRGPERVVVSGAVTYQGKPLPEATLRFVPDESSQVPAAGAIIADGKYVANGRGGVPVGTYKIEIEANRRVKRGSPAKPGEPVPLHADGLQQYIPAKYNAKTQLTITIPPGSGKITKDFDLTD